jgi:hypothetical protein
VHARKRGVESFGKREKDVKRGENKEKSSFFTFGLDLFMERTRH